MNTSSISSISATINGTARLVNRGTEEEAFFRERHLENNTFDAAEGDAIGSSRFRHDEGRDRETEAGRCFVEGEEVRVIIVRIHDVRISDWKGAVSEWNIVPESSESINGVR